jgi:predicted nucleotidyltransferase
MTLPQSEALHLRDQVRRMIAAGSLSFDELFASASDIIVFGSRAAGLNRPDSDLDLLIIADKSGHKRIGKLDLVFVPDEKVGSAAWRRTEIAGHVATFGVSLMNDRPAFDVIHDDYAALRKQARIHRLVSSLVPSWRLLNDELRRKYLIRVRRELQRFRFLRRGLPVPPTATLDLIVNSLGWIELAFEGIEDAAKIPKDEAFRVRELFTGESHRVLEGTRRSRGQRTRTAAKSER